jgi:pyruvate/2-oxoglutarate/acetoin dehydrogenase E1 component
MKYFDELTRSMTWLGEQQDTVFLGQSCSVPGTAMFNTLKFVAIEKRIELPVMEEQQMGITIGMALNGSVPVSIYPRWDFLILATNQLVNHLNRLKDISAGEYTPKCIIRTGIGSKRPLDPHAQHRNDYTEAYRLMCDNMEIIKVEEPEEIFPAYEKAYSRTDGKSTIIVEVSDYLNEK